ncbi:hypothetical protein DYB26_001471, partial [Aphanomyces astaci]
KHTESWRLNRCKDDQVAWNQRLHALPQHCTRSLVYGAHIPVPAMSQCLRCGHRTRASGCSLDQRSMLPPPLLRLLDFC